MENFPQINVTPENAVEIVRACCVVRVVGGQYTVHDDGRNPAMTDPETWEADAEVGRAFFGFNYFQGNSAKAAKEMRESLETYYSTVGRVSWQDDRI
jgi:hypothetical protein